MSSTRPVALVTGGARGIGLGISRCLAAAGYDLALCGVRTREEVEPTVEELRRVGGVVDYHRTDISESERRRSLLTWVRRRFDRLNLLVNNAGVAPRERKDLLDATEESFERVLRTNLQGPYFLTQAAARWMIERKRENPDDPACIVNVTSISAVYASVNRGEYCVSKAGLAMASRLWATRLGEFGIPVYEIRPGIIETDMTAGVREKYDRLITEGLLLQPRWGTPDDVGRAVTALASGAFSYSTGQVVMLDGGLHVARL
jgi:3-oxoacyl-[acyl-carrier protein] reductase